MDEQNQVTNREFNLLAIFFLFIAIYASIHKLFIPLALKFTSLRNTNYADIQPTILLPLGIALLAVRNKYLKILSFLCGAAVVFGCYEVYLTFLGTHKGWFAFSRLLSSIPLSIASCIYLSFRRLNSSQNYAWIGGLVFLSIIGRREFYVAQTELKNPIIVNPMVQNRNLPANTNTNCGAQEINIRYPSENVLSKIDIKECGLTPSTGIIKSTTLEIVNSLPKPVNLHLLIQDGVKTIAGWNLLVRANETIHSKKIEIPKGGAGLIYSDSEPGIGIIAVLEPMTHSEWNFTRKPIQIRRIP